VIHLGLSHNRCPRWITEGLATWEEEHKHACWTRNMRRDLIDALANDDLIRVRDLNRAFRGPRILFGYYEGGLLCKMLIDERGFALHSLRSPELSRLYVQCRPDEDIAEWPDERIWGELQSRLGLEGGTLAEGPVLDKGVIGMRSFVVEPMRHGRLYLAGDAAHIVPPTGAKGLNLAIADVRILADALASWHETGSHALLDGYSETCLRRVWRAEHFSWWMTSMLHRSPEGDAFEGKLQLSQLRNVVSSEAAATVLAENYVGLERV
jgi:p-hydroxybenzoate 3-monooxygenase